MKIFVYENIPLITVQALRAEGHDVLDIRGTPNEGMDDESLWKMIQRSGRLLITTDKGFARHRNAFHCGIMIIRLRQPNRQKIRK
jgi:predicted nuclease of predicted toxin-antitoxin system